MRKLLGGTGTGALILVLMVVDALAAPAPMPTYMRRSGLNATDTAIVGCTNGGYVGSGPCVRRVAPSLVSPTVDTLTGQRVVATVLRTTGVTDATVVGTNSSGNIVSAPTAGSGLVVLQTSTTATLTLSGCLSGGTGDAKFLKTGNQVTVIMPDIFCTSTSASGVISGIPSGYAPTTNQWMASYVIRNNTIFYMGFISVRNNSTFDLLFAPVSLVNGGMDAVGSTFTASGSKGISSATITYIVNL